MSRIPTMVCAVAGLTMACGESPPPTQPPGGNVAPQARFTLSGDAGTVPHTVTVDGSGSTDDGTVVAWDWTFGDGGTASGTTAQHEYADVGWFRVTLTVTDDRGATATASDSVVVDPASAGGANTLSGTVWWDRNADGVRDPGEPGIPGHMVFLDQNGSGEREAGEAADVTDGNGEYRFPGLHDTVTYRVAQRMTVGWTNTAPGVAGGSASARFAAARQVVGGTEAGADAYPFQVALLAAAVAAPEDAQFCGGTLVQGSWVMTAAHCVEGLAPEDVDVLVGTHDLRSGGTRVGVRRIRIFPEFGADQAIDNDIALMEIDGFFLLPRIWPQDPDRLSHSEPGTQATVIGFGRTHATAPGSDVLLEAPVPIISNLQCNAVYGTITDAMICGGPELNTDACNGDSGGPLMVADGPAWIQVGIVSFGFRCAAQPGVYARVTALEHYIRQVVPPEPSGDVVVDWSGGPAAVVDFGNFR